MEDGVREPGVVTGHVGKMLDLPDDVVPEIPDEPPVQRGQVREHRRPVGTEHGLNRGEHPVLGARRHLRRQGQGPVGGHRTPPAHQGGERIATHEGVPAPALPAFDGLEQEPGVVPDHEEEGAHGRERVGHDLAPHRHDAVVATELGEDVAPGAVGERPGAAHARAGEPPAATPASSVPKDR